MKLSDLKLTAEEEVKLDSFIGKATRKNAVFPLLSNRVGVSSKVTIQDIYSSSAQTIREMGKFLNKLISDNDPDFSVEKQSLKFGTIAAEEVKEALKLILKEKEYKSKLAAAKATKRALLEKQDSLKSPEERRKEIDAELALLSDVELEEVDG